MSKKLLRSKRNWYAQWHRHSLHGHVHWAIFILAAFVFLQIFKSFVSAQTDTIAPTVSITNPINKARISPGTSLSITASASDNLGIQYVDIFVSRVNQITGNKQTLERIHQCALYASPYVCDWTVPSKKNISYLIQAVAYDTFGNSTISKYVEFTAR